MVTFLADLKYSWDKHIWDAVSYKTSLRECKSTNFSRTHPLQTASQIRSGYQLEFVATILFTLASFLTKASLLAFYRRLLTSTMTKSFNRVLLVVFITILACHIWFLVGYLRICR